MGSVSISLITVTFNAADTIKTCIRSVIDQKYSNLEYIVIDAQSTDGTLEVIEQYKPFIQYIVCEPDKGIYDAMNKGIMLATGNIVGMLNADDFFAYNEVLNDVANAFSLSGADVVYGDIDYVNQKGKSVRKWRSGEYQSGRFSWGWMPPHPSFYARRELFTNWGMYLLPYGSATDYELMLRFIHTNQAKTYYLKKVMVKMLTGGVSNKNISNRFKAWQNDLKAMRANHIAFAYMCVVLKPLRKIFQYLR